MLAGRARATLTSLACLAACVCVCAACAVDPGLDQAAVVGGTVDRDHTAVVAIVQRRATCASREDLLCSGTLVAPRAVVTAAHCLEQRRPDELEVVFGDDLAAPGEVLAVWQGAIHPDYQPTGAPEAQADLAVLSLERAAPATIAPIALATAAPAPSDTVRVIGFGSPAAGAPSGARLAADATITQVDPLALWTGAAGVPCGGDSGGALLTAAGELAAVVKGSDTDCASQGLAIRTDAASARDFLTAASAATDLASSGRPAFAAGDAACTATCASHADCPLGQLCLPDGGAMRCGYRDGRVTGFGDRCTAASTDPACVPVGEGTERDCRLRVACDAAAGDGCCAASRADPRGTFALALVVLAALTLTDRRR